MRRWLPAVVLLSASCASVPIKKADTLALADADARVREGCYDCLLEARDVYVSVAVGKARPLVIQRLFETELLLALREKELALDPSDALARARALAGELPALVDANRYLAIVDAVPPDSMGSTVKELQAFEAAHAAVAPKVNDDVTWLATGALSEPVRQYLSLAIDCGYPTRPGRPPQTPGAGPPPAGTRQDLSRTAPPGAPPLVEYRAALCGGLATNPFELVRAEVPRFIETSYFLARIALLEALVKGPGQFRPLLAEAYARFSKSPAVTYVAGSFYQAVGDCKSGLRYYDETLAVKGAHERALLGRTICLTFLERFDEAVATATQMVEASISVADAYYWRAMDRRALQQLDVARADIERAKALRRSGEVFQLAGLIELDQNDLDAAEADFKSARNSRGGNRDCVSIFSLGIVYLKREQWPPSGDRFAEAVGCYELNAGDDQAGVLAIRSRTDLDPEYQASQIAGFEASLKKDLSQQYASAFNAASTYTRAGNYTKAKALLEVAATDPTLADKVKELRAILKDRQQAMTQ